MRPSWLRRSAMFAALAAGAATIAPFVPVLSVSAAECSPCVVIQKVKTVDGKEQDLGPELEVPLDWFRQEGNSDEGTIDVGASGSGEPFVYTHKVDLSAVMDFEGSDSAADLKFLESNSDGGNPRMVSKSEYQDGVIYVNEDALAFIPGSSGQSPNAFVADDQLLLKVHTTGTLLTSTIKVSDAKPTTKEKPKFTASVKPSTQESLDYIWDFGDGPPETTTTPTVSHQYKKKGSYSASLIVKGKDGSYGRAAAVTLNVGAPPKVAKPRKTRGTPTPTATPTSRPSSSSPTASPSTSWGGGYTPPRYIPPSSDLPSREPWPSDTPTTPVDHRLTQVEGYVLAGAEIVPGGTPETIPGVQDVTATPQATDRLTTRNIATWSIAAMGVVMLMGAGAASESRWLRRRLNTLRRRA